MSENVFTRMITETSQQYKRFPVENRAVDGVLLGVRFPAKTGVNMERNHSPALLMIHMHVLEI